MTRREESRSPATKPHKSYAELSALLRNRRMSMDNPARVERKLAQVGYYRLSGYWYPCRRHHLDNQGERIVCSVMKAPLRANEFMEGTSFEAVFDLYLMDKKLRLVLLDALERVEIHIRSIVAHELSALDPLAYQNSGYIDPKFLRGALTSRSTNPAISHWENWCTKHKSVLARSKEDWALWHERRNVPVPFWAAIEAWDFGVLSKYYSLLKGKLQGRIARRLGIADYTLLEGWLRELNIMRNRCAHHARVWNQTYAMFRDIPGEPYFRTLQLSENARTRTYGYITVLWFLLQRIGPGSNWLDQVADVIDHFPDLPGCSRSSLGLDPNVRRFPRELLRRAGNAAIQTTN